MVAIDIGGSHISSVEVVDIEKGILSDKIKRTHVETKNAGAESILDGWINNINHTIESSSSFDGKLAVAFPGPFDYQNGVVLIHQNDKFKPLQGMNLKREFMTRIPGVNSVHFENDAACFGLGEFHFGQKLTDQRLIALTIGTGIGCSFVDAGNLVVNGPNVPEGGEVYYLPFGNKTADDYFSTRWFVLEGLNYGYEVEGLRELIEVGEQSNLEEIFSQFVSNFIDFFIPISSMFNANYMVVGGNITKAWQHFGSEIVRHFNAKGVKVKKSTMGEMAICLGAAQSAKQHAI